MNFGTGGSPRWPVCQKNFVLLMTDGEPCSDGNIPTASAIIRSGNRPSNAGGYGLSILSRHQRNRVVLPASSLVNGACGGGGVKTTHGDESGLEDVALFMHTNDLRNATTLGDGQHHRLPGLTLYTVFAFGSGSTLLKYAAINGGFENRAPRNAGTGPPSNWDKNADGIPDTYFEANEGAALERAVKDAFSGILKRASSGTAASVLASGEGSGANLIQAVFYPRRAVGNDIIWWTGALQNMWYYVDPFFANASIREDTTQDNVLDLASDYIAQFFYDPASQPTQVRRWRSDDTGPRTTQDTTLSFENIHSLWEAGKKLWERNLTSSPRTINTSLDNTNPFIDFTTGNASTLSPYMQETGDNVLATIKYVNGLDNTDDLSLRSRTVNYGGDNNVWKLGDVVNSTPRIVAGVPLNKYDTTYFDSTYKSFIESPPTRTGAWYSRAATTGCSTPSCWGSSSFPGH